LEALWIKKEGTLEAHSYTENFDELTALCLLMYGFFRHTGVLSITKAEENKRTLGQAQTGPFLGDKC